MRHEYLHALEASGCASPETGWHPHHLLLHRKGQLVGAMPLYLKTHSRGEYVFDHAWAHAYARHGQHYYPKLISAVPFTPVPGPRLLAADPADRQTLLQAAVSLARNHDLSSLHILFMDDNDHESTLQAGLMHRNTIQFHWTNRSYDDMDGFLAAMTQRHRKKIRQDRRKLQQQGIRFEWLEGEEIDEPSLKFLYRCYEQTYLEHGNPPYLSLDFFREMRRIMPQDLVVIKALQDNAPIASALNLRSTNRLYGRYWGSVRAVSGLHFETCYMQGIEYCIARGIQVFEGGAQGEHKLARGMLPVRTHSAHWIAHPDYARAIKDYLDHETGMLDSYVAELSARSPFRSSDGPDRP